MKIYFHIGQYKTGTSAIQSFLNLNREMLVSKYKILYPNLNSINPGGGLMHNHAVFFNALYEDKSDVSFSKIKKCLEYCENKDIQNIIFSAEQFEFEWLPKLISQIVETFKTDYAIILYLRRQDNYLEATWKQWGHKHNSVSTVQEFASILHLNWYQTVMNWLNFFNPDKFIVRPYEKSVIGENVIIDFMSIFGIHDFNDFVEPPDTNCNKNHGLNLDVIEILRLCKNMAKDLFNHPLIDFMYNSLPEHYKKAPMVSYGILSPEERLYIIEQYSDSNKKVAKIFFGDNSELFKDPLPDINEPWEQYKGLTLESFIPILMEIVFKQYNDIQGLQKALYGDNLLISLSNKDLFNMSVYNDQIEHIMLHDNGVHFKSVKDDPFIILPKLKFPQASITMKLDISVPSNSFIQLFFKTSFYKSYSEEKSVRQYVNKGRQTVLIRIPAISIKGRLRLDPGNIPGNYIIHKIEFYC